ncbi:MAG: ATP-dependent RecD-like DNA helicase [Cyanobacteriota bacterium]|jgi:exodeoxyribonuclease V alpha subunit
MVEARPDRPTWLASLSLALAEGLPRLHGVAADPLIGELITALTLALERGSVELDLAGPAPEGVTPGLWPESHLEALRQSPLVKDPEGPLVVADDRLLWRRWQQQRQQVLEDLLSRARPCPLPIAPALAPTLEPARVSGTPQQALALDACQLQAVQAVLRHGLVLLEGGPGTGKTSTVSAMLTAVLEQAPHARIQLAAPTGKAAARLRAATGGRWPCATLHRVLESRGEGFGRHRGRPLELDLLVVDEVSMLDLQLTQSLLEALPPSCRLVLVGDPAQLPPIAPGPLLLELQRPERRRALGDAAVRLTTTYRNQGAIAAVAAGLRQTIEDPGDPIEDPGDPIEELRPRLEALPPEANLQWLQAVPSRLPQLLLTELEAHRRTLAELAGRCAPDQPEAEEVAAALLRERDRLLVLAPQRRGRWGIETLHRTLLGDRLAGSVAGWPLGTPVLCCRNLPELGLANGDVGVLVGGDSLPQRRLLFGAGGGEAPVWVHPAQLAGAVEPALALTVHKAQGSEAERVVVLLPAGQSDRRLLYTALTRARRQLLLITPRLAKEK